MDTRNETYSRQCRFLDDSYSLALYEAFIAAFSDYVMLFDLTEQQFRNHIILNAVDLNSSVGMMQAERLIGFTLNGFGEWNGISTVYDAGTGVRPEYRRLKLGTQMFDVMTPIFRDRGIKQYLLEVITENKNAIGLYEKLGFYTSRTLSLLHCENRLIVGETDPEGIEVRDVSEPDWTLFKSFWDGGPSWQNSIEAIDRSRMNKSFLGAYRGEDCLGYIVFSRPFGRIAQIAVDRNFRGLGVGSLLLKAMIAETSDDSTPQVINIDRSMDESMTFFANRGFTEKLSQFEMIREI